MTRTLIEELRHQAVNDRLISENQRGHVADLLEQAAARIAAERIAAERIENKPHKCQWLYDDEWHYLSSCGRTIGRGEYEATWTFCPFCGGEIEEKSE